jgi:hypothetical protein
MEKQNIELGNIGILDIRKATEESVANIKDIGNVGMLLYTPETAVLIQRLNMGNLGNSIEVPADARLLTGQVVFGQDYFKHQTTPLSLCVTGQIIVHPQIPAEDIETGLKELIIVGQMICPEHLSGAIQSKLRNIIGQTQTYTYTQSSRLTIGALTLDENYLRSLADGAEIVVIGDLKLPQVLPNNVFEQKVQRIQVTGKIVCREENAQVLFARLDDRTGQPQVTVIPTGFNVVEKQLLLDADLLKALPSQKLYCTERIQIEKDVTPEVLDSCLESLIARELVICPATLKEVIARKCNMLETDALFYEGDLWLVDNELTLPASRFDYLEGKATLVVLGELMLAPDVEPQVLINRLAKVHNFGEISCTPQQMGAIQSLLGVKYGELVDSTKRKADEDVDEEEEKLGGMGNVGYLAL